MVSSSKTSGEPLRTKRANNQPGAIVLGGNFVGLGVVRLLGMRGIETWVYDTDPSKCIAQFSRYTGRFVASKEPFHDLLLNEGRRHQLDGWVLIPVTDEYVELLSTHHQSLSSIYRVSTAPPEVTRFALDKRLTYSKAAELGIATPWTSVGGTPAELHANLRYPVILKPAINHHFFPLTNIKALLVERPADLAQRFEQMAQYIPTEEILIQECIPGGGESQFSLCAICKDGRAYATLVAQRRRQYPIVFGNASTFVQTIDQPVVEAQGRRFLENIGFNGIAEVEFKFDSRDSKYKILDVNMRPWGWHTLGKGAGIDFAYLLWQQMLGSDIPQINTPRAASWCREITDIVAIAKSPNRWVEIKTLLTAARKGQLTAATFSFRDPVPFLSELALWTSAGLSRQRKARKFLQLDPAGPQP
jgi:D-aspartate ligase